LVYEREDFHRLEKNYGLLLALEDHGNDTVVGDGRADRSHSANGHTVPPPQRGQ
jgi:hypothetical protein